MPTLIKDNWLLKAGKEENMDTLLLKITNDYGLADLALAGIVVISQ